ncbi:YraN family protein [Cohnella sp. GCM10027633]|uniref:YraN family protein n=1 Tax=unclassified Cohnella TaxID=2636738 RepID=UPI00362840CC
MNEREPSSRARHARSSVDRAAVGRMGEAAAADYLTRLGYRMLERNWRCRFGEIDLIADDGGTLVFVEVRSRTNPTRFGTAIEAITDRKRRQVREVAAYYLMKRQAGKDTSVRCDAVAVTFRSDGTVSDLKHVPGAF